jgi:hypothetical protein
MNFDQGQFDQEKKKAGRNQMLAQMLQQYGQQNSGGTPLSAALGGLQQFAGMQLGQKASDQLQRNKMLNQNARLYGTTVA